MNNATAVDIADGGGTVGNLVISNVGVGVGTSLVRPSTSTRAARSTCSSTRSPRPGAATGIDLGRHHRPRRHRQRFTVSGLTTINDATARRHHDRAILAQRHLHRQDVTILNDAGGANGDGVDLALAAGGANTGVYNFNGGVDITVNGTDAFGFRAQ